MRRPFSVDVARRIHARILMATGGASGVRDRGLLEASLSAPFQTFGGTDLYPGIVEKAAALASGIIRNHPFVDGNKRTAYVLMMTLLRDYQMLLTASADEREHALVAVADGSWTPEQFGEWLKAKVSKR